MSAESADNLYLPAEPIKGSKKTNGGGDTKKRKRGGDNKGDAAVGVGPSISAADFWLGDGPSVDSSGFVAPEDSGAGALIRYSFHRHVKFLEAVGEEGIAVRERLEWELAADSILQLICRHPFVDRSKQTAIFDFISPIAQQPIEIGEQVGKKKAGKQKTKIEVNSFNTI